MDIYKQIFLIFAILVVQRSCEKTTEKYEETKLEPAEESFPLDGDSTHPESEFSDGKFHTMDKRSLELDLGNKETTEDSKDSSESEYSTQTTNSANSESDLHTDESQAKRSDFVTEKYETDINSKHQLRGLKDYKIKDGEERIPKYKRKIDLNEQEKPVVNLNLNIGLKKAEPKTTTTKPKTTTKPFMDSFPVENLMIFKDGETEPHKVIDVRKYFAAFRDMGIDPAHLKQGDPEVITSIHEIHKNFLELIEEDIKSNIYPFIFYHTVAPVIKEKLIPLIGPNVMKAGQQLILDYKIRRLLNILLDLTDLSKYITRRDDSRFLALSEFFAIYKVENNEYNMKLAILFEKNLEDLLEIIDEEWKEYNAPASFIHYMLVYSNEQSFVIRAEDFLRRIQLEKNRIISSHKEELTKAKDSKILTKMYQWAKNILGFGGPQQEL